MESVNRQWGLRLWSKTNRTFGEGFQQLNQFRAAENIPRHAFVSIENDNS